MAHAERSLLSIGISEDLSKVLSPESNRVFRNALREAISLRNSHLGTEHILLGLVEDENVGKFLKGEERSIDSFRKSIRFTYGQGDTLVDISALHLTPRAENVINFALEEFKGEGAQALTPMHLLIGLLREREGKAIGILLNFGIMPEQLLEKLREVREEQA
ncbi:hypothetical protein A2165_04420 [Candidatus Curtissbacteria bacterium RBG_13_40_7]|uniref:Clp R domain-containing protein n=1 Tax=Candidatus Curtissbacteria bacterium RBG_13_40_7 TaxID=1797706 RepID=A0A1F5FVB2_9BACT|nr:MAG: hypothetical protein A2165_04420 [Candidatus Curtissbacteria bacterium RBG_13_40_7]